MNNQSIRADISGGSQPVEAFKSFWRTDAGFLLGVCLAWLVFLMGVTILSSGETGFHRDELGFLDNANALDWGFVEYPPFTPFLARLSLALFGPSLIGLRLFSELAVCATMWLTGRMAYELGGSRRAQLLAALAVGLAPIVLFNTNFFSYQTFDFLWWVLAAYALLRLLKSGNPRWWLAAGAAIGLGMMTKYTAAFWVAGIVVGVLLSPARRYLKSPWLWGGAGLALLIFLPNLIWQVQHNFISLEFLSSIHERDVQIGRTGDFLISQLYICVNAAAIFLWVNGLRFYLLSPAGRNYRPLGWMAVVPFLLFLVSQGRFYYLAPAYPMLIAAGAAAFERWAESKPERQRNLWRGVQYGGLAFVGLAVIALMLPLAPVNSDWWKLTADVNTEVRERIGWPELVSTVAGIRDGLPAEERARAGILVGNFGEAGAINFYGPAFHLPPAISATNSGWLRGYGSTPPETVILVGFDQKFAAYFFGECLKAGTVTNRYGIQNEEAGRHPDLFVCRKPRFSWPVFWEQIQNFG